MPSRGQGKIDFADRKIAQSERLIRPRVRGRRFRLRNGSDNVNSVLAAGSGTLSRSMSRLRPWEDAILVADVGVDDRDVVVDAHLAS
jgi:hypothetical protein